MSRHLMAKMRREAARLVEWQHGVLLPHSAHGLADYNERYAGTSPSYPEYRPEDYSTAMVSHGERMHALQVAREPMMNNSAADGGVPWVWSLHTLTGHDPKDPDHWGWMNEFDENDPDVGEEGEWDWAGSNTGGQMGNWSQHNMPGDFSDGTNGGYWGYSPSREHAMQSAQNAWDRHMGENGNGLGDVDVNDIARGGGGAAPGGHSLGDEDFGDIFGERP